MVQDNDKKDFDQLSVVKEEDPYQLILEQSNLQDQQHRRTLTAFQQSEKIEDQVEAMIGKNYSQLDSEQDQFSIKLHEIATNPRRRFTTLKQSENIADQLSAMMKTQGSFKRDDRELNMNRSNLSISNLLPKTPQQENEAEKQSSLQNGTQQKRDESTLNSNDVSKFLDQQIAKNSKEE